MAAMTAVAELAPLTKTVAVPAPVDRAFALFTERIASWWPLATHSVGEDAATGLEMQCRVGGQIVETVADGTTHVWGTLTDWEPPRRVAFSWHPGRAADEATRVEVTFAPQGEGTLVTLVHSGWAGRPDGAQARVGYDTGWDVVLAHLPTAAGAGG
jgi:uncharacterized protein YndB with AHSA1/START domain